MTDDPRSRNRIFDSRSISSFMDGYVTLLARSLEAVDREQLQAAQAVLEAAAQTGNAIFAIGNGGSAAIADHLVCDLAKGAHHERHPPLRAQSMTSNVALYSAMANDTGFEQVFAGQVSLFGRPGDVLIAISSSGESPNIINAVSAAKRLGMTVIGLSGFAGGRLRQAADISLHVPADNYGIVEDAHQSIMHVIAQYTSTLRDQA
jgi:D-sedoheptulose 7-phosphate isomerase